MAFREAVIQGLLCDFIRAQYPWVIFASDSSGEHRATVQQRARAKRLRSHRGYPDFFLAEPKGIYHGLYLELKEEGAVLTMLKDGRKIRERKKGNRVIWRDTKIRKTGDWADAHIEEQAKCLEILRSKGYKAVFVIGFDNAVRVVRAYMNLKPNQEMSFHSANETSQLVESAINNKPAEVF